jgi:hypothetical protein
MLQFSRVENAVDFRLEFNALRVTISSYRSVDPGAAQSGV